MSKLFEDVACPACGCVCDDLAVEVEKSEILRVERSCALGEAWFLQPRSQEPQTMAHGKPASYEEALVASAQMLSRSVAPLVYGLSCTSTGGVRAACQLAEAMGGTLDTAAAQESLPCYVAQQTLGMSTATLGEVRNRADLVIYWGCDPVETHPRHVERFVDAAGMFVPDGRDGRQVFVIDNKRSATSDIANQFLQVNSGGDFELMTALQTELQNLSFDREAVAGVSMPEIQALAQAMKACKYGVIFFGSSFPKATVPSATFEALFRLVRELNAYTRFVACPLHQLSDKGASQTITWQTGYPSSVSFAKGYPRYNAGEFSANTLLERGEVDSVLLVGAQELGELSAKASERFHELPLLVIGPNAQTEWSHAQAGFLTSEYGIQRVGTAYRMDGVPIPLSKVVETSLPSDEKVLLDILNEFTELRARTTGVLESTRNSLS